MTIKIQIESLKNINVNVLCCWYLTAVQKAGSSCRHFEVTWCHVALWLVNVEAFVDKRKWCLEVFAYKWRFQTRKIVVYRGFWHKLIWLTYTTCGEQSPNVFISFLTEVAFRGFCIWTLRLSIRHTSRWTCPPVMS